MIIINELQNLSHFHIRTLKLQPKCKTMNISSISKHYLCWVCVLLRGNTNIELCLMLHPLFVQFFLCKYHLSPTHIEAIVLFIISLYTLISLLAWSTHGHESDLHLHNLNLTNVLNSKMDVILIKFLLTIVLQFRMEFACWCAKCSVWAVYDNTAPKKRLLTLFKMLRRYIHI